MVHKVKIRTQSEKQCPVCESGRIEVFYEALQMPVHVHLLWPEREDALSVPKGDIRLASCAECGHIFNTDFNPDLVKYNEWYESSLHRSSRFQSYSRQIADRLIDRYDLKKKDVIEIGSRQVDFLELICELGENRGIGFYPGSADDPALSTTRQMVTFVHNISSDQYTRYQADLICCSGLLEHIYRPREFVSALRRDIGDKLETVGFVEVPNGLDRLRSRAVWDFAYEDFSCYTPDSLTYLLVNNGFEVIEQGTALDGQVLTADIRPRIEDLTGAMKAERNSLEAIRQEALAFKAFFQEKVDFLRMKVAEWKAAEKKVVLWGSGLKENYFLNALKVDESIMHVVDVNLHHRGLHVAGSGHRIVSPAALRSLRPDVLLLMDPSSESELYPFVTAGERSPEVLII